MDLRNFTGTPNQLEPVMQRRTSLSSLSTTSGYGSSAYGGIGNGTPRLSNQRLSQSKVANTGSGEANNSGMQYSWMNQDVGNESLDSTSLKISNAVEPWVEQQKEQTGVAALDSLSEKMIESLETGSIKEDISNSSLTNDGNDFNKDIEREENRNHSDDKTMRDRQNERDGNNQEGYKTFGTSENEPGQKNLKEENSKSGGGNNKGSNKKESVSASNNGEDDELIPTAVVIKNIPFAIKKEQLLDVMSKLLLPLPYAFNYHFDNGVFRGLAFANFTLAEETYLVVNHLNGREVGGRKLRVEYKKMLPLQERERIEREKREKRGQLEEQHRSTSNASLASLLSAASTTAATKNQSVNGTVNNQTERVYLSYPPVNPSIKYVPSELNFNDPEVLELYSRLLLFRDDIGKSVYELAVPLSMNAQQRKTLSFLCSYLNLLELFDNGLVIIRRKIGQNPSQQFQQQATSQQQSPRSASMMNLNQLSGIMSLAPNNNITQTNPELLRSQSQSVLQLPRLRQQTVTPAQANLPQFPGPALSSQTIGGFEQTPISVPATISSGMTSVSPQVPPNIGNGLLQNPQQQNRSVYPVNTGQNQPPYMYQQPLGGTSNAGSQMATPTVGTSAAAFLRSNSKPFLDTRGTPSGVGLSQQPQYPSDSPTPLLNHYFNKFSANNNPSQPSSPLINHDLSSRFSPFGQHASLSESLSSLPAGKLLAQTIRDNTSNVNHNPDAIGAKLGSINLSESGHNSPANSSSGIWGPK